MATRYEVRRKLADGENVCVAVCPNRKQADWIARSLNQEWPAQYEILEVVEDGPPES
jgi:hypothetical protein